MVSRGVLFLVFVAGCHALIEELTISYDPRHVFHIESFGCVQLLSRSKCKVLISDDDV